MPLISKPLNCVHVSLMSHRISLGHLYSSTALLVGRSRDRFPVVSVTWDFPAAADGTICPGVDSASKNEHQGVLLELRRPVRKADDLPPSQCRTSRKSGVLTYPEPLGPPRPVVGDLYLYQFYCSNSSQVPGGWVCRVKNGKVHTITGHEGPEVEKGFL